MRFRARKSWLFSCCCFVRRESESPLAGAHDDYVNKDALRDYANRDSLCDDYGDDYANRDAIREARDRDRERERERDRERERPPSDYREYVNAPAWHDADDNRNTQRRQTARSTYHLLTTLLAMPHIK